MRLRFDEQDVELSPGETVLEGLERSGVSVPSFCRGGACQTCLLRARSGQVPAAAQAGLKDAWKKQGYFLSCVCKPGEPLEVERCVEAKSYASRVQSVQQLSERVLRVLLDPPPDFSFEAGQFVQLVRPSDGLMRPYSLASVPGQRSLELHVALLPNGRMSQWLRSAAGAEVELRGPYGECFYLSDEPERPLILAGTGTGLAPLVGVVRAALQAGHRGSIALFHGARSERDLYFWRELRELAAAAPNLSVIGSVLSPDVLSPEGTSLALGPRVALEQRPLDELVLAGTEDWAAGRTYLCGDPTFVRSLKKRAFLAGASLQRIHSDPFLAPAAMN